MTDYLHGEALWQNVQTVSKSALASGALKSIPTACEVRDIATGGKEIVKFQIRVVENLIRKSKEVQDRAQQLPNLKNTDQKPFNPFLPYEPDLYVGELTNHYRCLLNKFNVMDHHILMVTNKFVPQQTPLDVEDFLAALICLQAHDGLVFYNGGTEAGASVEHKHLQMIPLSMNNPPTGENTLPFPFYNVLATTLQNKKDNELTVSALPFKHRIVTTAFPTEFPNTTSVENLRTYAEINCNNYHRMLKELSLPINNSGMMSPHNLLITRDFLWVIPRHCESHQGLAVNALGFAGTLLVKNTEHLNVLDSIGCLSLLSAVALPR